jgi:phospholipase C
MTASLDHVFVLMLENRSFDHLFGFSGLSGVDAGTGAHTVVEGLDGTESNTFGGRTYPVTRGADYATPRDPGHEFPDVLDQLCGPNVRYVPPYPPIHSSGFADSYGRTGGGNVAEVMKCFDTARQLPVLYALAQEYAICDHWFSSMPGPTWPNRMFVHAGSSGGLDHSPSTADILKWETVDGFRLENGTIFDALSKNQLKYHMYSGDEFPMVAALKGVTLFDVHRIDTLVSDLKKGPFPYSYVFIEPSYNLLHDYRNSSSMHPLADVRDGEALVKKVYEAIRSSPIWERSVLVITWDEHGGFYDHVEPPRATAPGDTKPGGPNNKYGFTFEQYGARTPAIVVSPLIPKNTIDHRVYDHCSILATLRAHYGLSKLTNRDANARSLLSLLSLSVPRVGEDACATLPTPAAAPAILAAATPAPDGPVGSGPLTRQDDSVDAGVLPTIIQSALRQDLQLDPSRKAAILARVAALETRGDAMTYLADVQTKLRTRGDMPPPSVPPDEQA